MFTRRHFLSTSSSFLTHSLALSLLLRGRSYASTGEDPHFFVLFGVPFTMDCTLGLNPLSHAENNTTQNDIFLEYSPYNLRKSGNLLLGPSAFPLLPFTNDIAIINGIQMRLDIGHTLDYIATGSGSRREADIATELSMLYRGKLGLLSGNTSNINGHHSPLVSNLSNLLNPRQDEDKEYELLQSVLNDNNTSKAARESNLSEEELKKMTEIVSSLESQGFSRERANLAAAFVLRLSFQAVIGPMVSVNLDTHSNHVNNHLRDQRTVWEEVADLFKMFKGIPYADKSLFDHTTFMVVTEMSRTPFLNSSGGKDHNEHTNSVLLAGKGIKGNTVLGHSVALKKNNSRPDPRHVGLPIDYRTGEVVRKLRNDMSHVENIFPENVIGTVAQLFDYQKMYLESESVYRARILPRLLKGRS